jgi:hypothetical protein
MIANVMIAVRMAAYGKGIPNSRLKPNTPPRNSASVVAIAAIAATK